MTNHFENGRQFYIEYPKTIFVQKLDKDNFVLKIYKNQNYN